MENVIRPVERSIILRAADEITRCPYIGGLIGRTIIGPARVITSIVVGIIAKSGAVITGFLGFSDAAKKCNFFARRSLDECSRGVTEILPLLSWIMGINPDKGREIRKDGNFNFWIRNGSAYGQFMYQTPEGQILYSKYKGPIVPGSIEPCSLRNKYRVRAILDVTKTLSDATLYPEIFSS